MSVIRTVKDKQNPYVMVDKTGINDCGLSFKAKGLLCYLLSLPDDRDIYLADLVTRSSDGEHSIREGIKELVDHGYMIQGERIRKPNGGLGGYNYELHEKSSNGYKFVDKKGEKYVSQGKSYIGKSQVGKSYIGKSQDNNNELEQNNKNINNNKEIRINNNINNSEKLDFSYEEETSSLNIFKEKEKSSAKKEKESGTITVINKNNIQNGKDVWDTIKKYTPVIDGNMNDCVLLYHKLKEYGGDPIVLLDHMIQAMISTGITEWYSYASPSKLRSNLGTIYTKLVSLNQLKQQQTKRVFKY